MATRTRKVQKKGPQYQAKKQLSIDLATDLADHAQELLWGQGFNFTHESDSANKRLQELLSYNRANELFPDLEKQLSLYGNMYMTIDMVEGKPTWLIADPIMNSQANVGTAPGNDSTMHGVGRALVTDVVAVIWKRITFATVNFPIKEIWTRNKVKRIFFGENGKVVKLNVVNEHLPPEDQLTEEWEHNMGFVPVVWFKNLPTFNRLAPKDGYKGESVQTLLDKTLSELWHETETNRTRLVGNLDETTYNQIRKNGDFNTLNKSDFLINVQFKNSSGDAENVLTPMMGNPNFDKYWDSVHQAKDEYYKLGGYSPLGDGSTEKTATESLLMKTGDYQVTKKKRNQRSGEITELLTKTLDVDAKWGLGDIYGDLTTSLSVEILENKVMDSLHEVQNYQVMIDNDLMSRVEAIAKFRGITKEEAEAVFKDILEEKKAYAEVVEEITPDAEGEEEEAKEDDKSEDKE